MTRLNPRPFALLTRGQLKTLIEWLPSSPTCDEDTHSPPAVALHAHAVAELRLREDPHD